MDTGKTQAENTKRYSGPITTFEFPDGREVSIIASQMLSPLEHGTIQYGMVGPPVIELSILARTELTESSSLGPVGQTVTLRILLTEDPLDTSMTMQVAPPIMLPATPSHQQSSQSESDSAPSSPKPETVSKCSHHQWDPHLKFCVTCGSR